MRKRCNRKGVLLFILLLGVSLPIFLLSCGGSDTPPSVADFTASPTTGPVPLTVAFTDLSTGAPTSWSWDFGDGETSTAQNPSHNYLAGGTYTVTLAVDGPGIQDSLTKVGYVKVTPAAQFEGTPTTGILPLTVVFTDQSTSDATSWSWDFGDGETSAAQNPSHTYNDAGSYTVSLIATGPGGPDTETKPNYITVGPIPPAPVADFSGTPTSGSVPFTVNFTDLSTGIVSSWFWDFGDGETSTDQNPSHIYVTSGTHDVALTATGPGGPDTETKPGYITANPSVFTDDFNRADENPLGGNWTTAPGCSNMQIIANVVVAVDNGVFNCAYWSAYPFNNDQYSQVRITFSGGNKGPAVRIQTPAAQQNFYYAVIDNNTTISVKSNVNGAFSVIGAPFTVPALQPGDTIKLSAVGTTLELFVNGGSQGTRTDATFSSGVPGIWSFYLDRPLDDWEGGSY